MHDWKMTDQIARPENAGPENAGLENGELEFDGPEQRAVMSLVQEHMHTLKTVPISLCRHTHFETVIFFTLGLQLSSCLFFNGHFRFMYLFNLHYTNLLMIMTNAHNILSKVNNVNSIEQFLAHSLIITLNVS